MRYDEQNGCDGRERELKPRLQQRRRLPREQDHRTESQRVPSIVGARREPGKRADATGDSRTNDGRLPTDGEGVGENRRDRRNVYAHATYAQQPCDGADGQRHDGDVLTRHRRHVRQTGGAELLPQTCVQRRIVTEYEAAQQRQPLPGRAALECPLQVRAQLVGDSTDPAPPADDPCRVRTQHDVDAASRQPRTLVEAGLGPTRRDQPRAHDLQHGAARRRTPAADLQQSALAHDEAGEATNLDRKTHGEGCRAGWPDHRDACTPGLTDPQRQHASVESVGSQRAPSQAEQSECHGACDHAAPTGRRDEHGDESRCGAGQWQSERHGDPVSCGEPCAHSQHERGRPAIQNTPDHGVTSSRNCSIRAGPIPGTWSRSSTDANGPCV